MLKHLLTLTGAGLMAAGLATSAGAASLDFMAEANSSERGVNNGTVINFDGLDVTFTSSHFAYFDSGDAGLGVCKVLTASKQCNPASDDNVTSGESVTISFAAAQDLSNLKFRAEGHIPLTSLDTLLFGINGGSLLSYTFANLSTLSFSGVTSATFAFGGDKADQFYVQSVTAVNTVPLPASALLMLAGLGALGALRRRPAFV